MNLLELRGMVPVDDPHGLLLGPGFVGQHLIARKGWKSSVYEYETQDNKDQYPHVLLLTILSTFGQEGSIPYGELASIITAMRNRASQPVMLKNKPAEDEDTDEDDIEFDFKKLLFENEKRFPVLMVSLVGPQHGLISYACMDGSNLVIRQSSLFSFEKLVTASVIFFSRTLLSEPLKGPVEEIPVDSNENEAERDRAEGIPVKGLLVPAYEESLGNKGQLINI